MVQIAYYSILKKLVDSKLYNMVQLYSNQYAELSENTIITPAIYIQFQDLQFINTGNGLQKANVNITFHIVATEINFDNLANTEYTRTIFDLLEKTHQVLNGFVIYQDGFQYSSKLERTNMSQLVGYGLSNIWTITYQTILHEKPQPLIKTVINDFKIKTN